MNVIIYMNNGERKFIKGVNFITYDLSAKRVDFFSKDKSSYSLKLDEFWTMKVREDYENKEN